MFLFSGKKISRSASSVSSDFSSLTPSTSSAQVSMSLIYERQSNTAENEQAEEKNIPENSSQNNNAEIVNREERNVDALEGPQSSGEVQEDLASRSQSSTGYGMASPSESSLPFESPRDEAMEVTGAGEQDESLGRADGDNSAPEASWDRNSEGCAENQPSSSVHQAKRFKTETNLVISESGNVAQCKQSEMPDDDPTINIETRIDLTSEGSPLGDASGVKKQTASGTDNAEQNTESGNDRPESASVTKPSNLPASESENKLDDDKKKTTSYANVVKENPAIQNQGNSGDQQKPTLKEVAQHSDSSRKVSGPQSGSDATTTVTSQDGKIVS